MMWGTWKSRCQRAFSGRPLFAVELTLILSAGTFLALWLRPEPHGDWAYYWEAAGNLDDYRRGGLSLLLLSGLKLLGLSPVAAALLINLAAVVALLWLFRRVDATESRVFALFAAAYLLLLSPYFGIVQLNLIAAAELAFGIALILMPMSAGSIQVRTAVAVVLVAAAVSTKPQYALTIWAMLGLFALLLALLRRSPPRVIAALLAVLLLGSVTGFATDLGMRAWSNRFHAHNFRRHAVWRFVDVIDICGVALRLLDAGGGRGRTGRYAQAAAFGGAGAHV